MVDTATPHGFAYVQEWCMGIWGPLFALSKKVLIIKWRFKWSNLMRDIAFPLLCFCWIFVGFAAYEGPPDSIEFTPCYDHYRDVWVGDGCPDHDPFRLEPLYTYIELPDVTRQIVFSPNDTLTRQLMYNMLMNVDVNGTGCHLSSYVNINDVLVGVNTAQDVRNYFIANQESYLGFQDSSVWLGLSFNNQDNNTYNSYIIHHMSGYLPNEMVISTFLNMLPESSNFGNDGILKLQQCISNQVIIELNLTSSMNNTMNVTDNNINVERYPTQAWEVNFDDSYGWIIGRDEWVMNTFVLFFTLALMGILFSVTITVVQEKEKRLVEGLDMLGLNYMIYYLSVYSYYIVSNLLLSILITAWLTSYMFDMIHFGKFWMYMYLYMMLTVLYSFIVFRIFKRSGIASIVGSIFLFIYQFIGPLSFGLTVFVGSFNSNINQSQLDSLTYLFSPIGLQNFIYRAIQAQNSGKDLSDEWWSFYFNALFLNCIWIVIILFISHKERNIRFFFNTMFMYCSHKIGYNNNDIPLIDVKTDSDDGKEEEENNNNQNNINMTPAIHIKNLTKKYNNNFIAVGSKGSGLNAIFYDNEVVALLGHNGAGKTTLIEMLTNMTEPTSGTITMFGQPNNKQNGLVGVCPQFDVLWDNLTVYEHLELFQRIKCGQIDDNEIQYTLECLNMSERKNAFSCTLSGGEKRRLSIALALIGDSKIIILDEPTSGVDPSSRRKIWSLLKEFRSKRDFLVLLTTHFLDEAEQFSDRIAILDGGNLLGVGTSEQFKNKYAVGYTLSVSFDENKKDNTYDSLYILDCIKEYVPNAVITEGMRSNISFVLPTSNRNQYSNLIEYLGANYKRLGITKAISITVNTLDDVFNEIENLKINNNNDDNNDKINNLSVDERHRYLEGIKTMPDEHMSILKWIFSLILVLWKKRFILQIRDKSFLLVSIFVPSIIWVVGFVMLSAFNGEACVSNGIINDYTNFENYAINFFPLIMNNLNNEIIRFPVVGLNESDIYSDALTITLSHTMNNNITLEYISDYDSLMNLLSNEDHIVTPSFGGLHFYTPINKTTKTVSLLYNASYSFSEPVLLSIHQATEVLLSLSEKNQITLKEASFYTEYINILSNGINELPPAESFGCNLGIFMYIIVALPGYILSIIAGIEYLSKEHVTGLKGLQQLMMHSKEIYWLSHGLYDFIFNSLITFIWYLPIYTQLSDSLYTEYHSQALWQVSLGILTIQLYGYIRLYNYDKDNASRIHGSLVAQISVSNLIFLMAYLTTALSFGLDSFINMICNMVFCLLSPGFSIIRIVLIVGNIAHMGDLIIDKYSFAVTGSIEFILYIQLISGMIYLFMFKERPKMTLYQRVKYTFSCFSCVSCFACFNKNKNDENDATVQLHSLQKQYKNQSNGENVTAVKDVSLNVNKGEMYGLLGTSGAGKTTTLDMLKGNVVPTEGKAIMNGYDVHKNNSKAVARLGICPQHSVLDDYLTVYEQISLYAILKGIHKDKASIVADSFLKLMHIEHYKDRYTCNLSGGNQRKVSLALALLGDPDVILLDEVSTGMDVMSRRLMWQFLKEIAVDKAIIITTHSMTESEALCDKIGVMMSGGIEASGTLDHLRNEYASYIIVKCTLLATTEEKKFQSVFLTEFPYAEFSDKEVIIGQGMVNIIGEAINNNQQNIQNNAENDNNNDQQIATITVRIPIKSNDDKNNNDNDEPIESSKTLARLFDFLCHDEKGHENDHVQINSFLGISDFTISQSSMQDVFYAVTEKPSEEQQQ